MAGRVWTMWCDVARSARRSPLVNVALAVGLGLLNGGLAVTALVRNEPVTAVVLLQFAFAAALLALGSGAPLHQPPEPAGVLDLLAGGWLSAATVIVMFLA